MSTDEEARVAALHSNKILDTQREQAFDDLTSLAARICETPVALISGLDQGRQRVRSAHGMSRQEASRGMPFCEHAIHQPEALFVVPDSQQDPQFATDPLAADPPSIRFYASIVLRSPDHHAVGTLCVIDYVPRVLSDLQLEALQQLGRQAVAQLELRRVLNSLSDQLAGAREIAGFASKRMSDFLANISHEIRTPINGILGLSRILLDTPLEPTQRSYVATVHRSVETLLAIISDILDISEIEAGKLSVEAVPMELRPTINEAVGVAGARGLAKGLRFNVLIDPSLPVHVAADPDRLKQVLMNLADNAVKFTSSGDVAIEVETLRKPKAGEWILFTVRDTGIGIPEDRLAHIFEKFTQVDSSTTREYGGTGLGLAICSQLVRLMGGELTVRTEIGTGSTFSFTVPLRPMRAVPSWDSGHSVPQNVMRPALDVLLAEDNATNQLVARLFLEKAGCHVDIVPNGQEAVRRVEAHAYDVVFMDCQMPVMDGYDATRRIRQLPGRADTPIVAMTVYAMEGDREKCVSAGMTDYVSKPVTPEAILGVLSKLGALGVESVKGASPTVPVSLVDLAFVEEQMGDDEAVHRELFDLMARDLDQLGREIRVALDGRAWETLGRIAHRVAGCASNVGARDVCGVADEIMVKIRGGHLEGLDEPGIRLEQNMAKLAAALRVLLGAPQTMVKD